METINKTTEHGVHNSKIHDNAAKIVFGDSTLCAQFLKGYTDIPFFMNIKPEDIEDVSSHFIPLFQESRDSNIVKKIQLENTELYLIALIEHQSEADINVNIKMYIFDHLRMYIFAILPLDRYIFLSDKIFL